MTGDARGLRAALVSHNAVPGDGQGRVVLELARALRNRGVDVTLVAAAVDPALLEEGVRWLRVTVPLERPHLIKVWSFARRADRVLEEHEGRFDVVHAHGFVTRRPHAVNTVHFVHAAWLRRNGPRGPYQRLFHRLNARWERSAFAAAGTLVAVSPLVRDELVELGWGPWVRVIPHGVRLPASPPASSNGTVDLRAFFAGDLATPRKNLDTVLRALGRVPEARLDVAGSLRGSPYPARVRRLGLEGRVRFLGHVPDLAERLSKAEVLLCPSLYDPFSLVLLEGLAAGLPVVTARTVGAAALVEEGCGWVLDDPRDDAALADRLRTLAADPGLRARMGARAREVAARHGWDAAADRYLALYREAVMSRGAG